MQLKTEEHKKVMWPKEVLAVGILIVIFFRHFSKVLDQTNTISVAEASPELCELLFLLALILTIAFQTDLERKDWSVGGRMLKTMLIIPIWTVIGIAVSVIGFETGFYFAFFGSMSYFAYWALEGIVYFFRNT